jgi:hypothetical protein
METVEHLRWLHEEFSDEIPKEILSGHSPNRAYKVRGNWWAGVIADLDEMRHEEQIPLELSEEIDAFIAHYTSDEFHYQPLTLKDDIDRANSLIGRLLLNSAS